MEWVQSVIGPLTGAGVLLFAAMVGALVKQHFDVRGLKKENAALHRRLDRGADWRKDHDAETGRIERLILESEGRIKEDMHREIGGLRDRISRLEGKLGNGGKTHG